MHEEKSRPIRSPANAGFGDVSQHRQPDPADIIRCAALVPVVRARIDLDRAVSDDAVLLSLLAIDRHTTLGGRWSAAFASELGSALTARRGDLVGALATVLTLMPPPKNGARD